MCRTKTSKSNPREELESKIHKNNSVSVCIECTHTDCVFVVSAQRIRCAVPCCSLGSLVTENSQWNGPKMWVQLEQQNHRVRVLNLTAFWHKCTCTFVCMPGPVCHCWQRSRSFVFLVCAVFGVFGTLFKSTEHFRSLITNRMVYPYKTQKSTMKVRAFRGSYGKTSTKTLFFLGLERRTGDRASERVCVCLCVDGFPQNTFT